MKKILSILACTVIFQFCTAQNESFKYLNHTVPSDTPMIFLNGISERIAISNDFKEIYYNDSTGTSFYKYSENMWNGPFKLFKGLHCPSLSPDNKTMFFQDKNPEAWYSTRIGNKWSAPIKFWNDPQTKHYLQVTNSGNYYLSYNLKGLVNGNISRITINKSDTVVESLGVPINSKDNGIDFFIARDESYIIFVIHPGGVNGDLYISFHKKDGTWKAPKNLGSLINTSAWEWGPYVTIDNKYLFFTRGTSASNINIYWVRIDSLLNKLKNDD